MISVVAAAAAVVEGRWEGYTEAESVTAVVDQAAADVAVDTHAPYNHAALFHWGQIRYIQRLNSAHERP